VSLPDGFVIPPELGGGGPQADDAPLAEGWGGGNNGYNNTTTSGAFSWTSATTAVYNLKNSLSLQGVKDLTASGALLGAQYVIREAAKLAGVKALWDAAKRDRALSTALTNFVNSGTDTLNQLLNGFNTGMTPEQADAALQKFMDNAGFKFHQTAEKVIGTGTGYPLNVLMRGLRLTEQWVVNPSTGAITHSKVGVEDGTRPEYYGQYSGYITPEGPTPWYGNDVVLAGDNSDMIDTGLDAGLTPRAQIDFVAAGGGADVVRTYEGRM
jgi:hypothetical protein